MTQFTTLPMTHMTHAALLRDGVEIAFAGGRGHLFTLSWLRDHCGCAACHHPETRQRLVDTFALPADLMPAGIELGAGGATLSIAWSDGHQTGFTASELVQSLSPVGLLASDITTWNDAEIAADFPQVAF